MAFAAAAGRLHRRGLGAGRLGILGRWRHAREDRLLRLFVVPLRDELEVEHLLEALRAVQGGGQHPHEDRSLGF